MRDIFLRKQFEDKYQEQIIGVFDIEGYEAKEVIPFGKYGYKINTNHLYKLLTDKNIYFIEDGKVTNNPKILQGD